MPLNSSLMVDAPASPWPRTRRHPRGTKPRPFSADSLCVGGAAWPAARILPTSPMANGRSSNGFCPSRNKMVSPANLRRNLVNPMLDILRGGRLATPAHEFSTWNTVLPLIPAMTAGSPLRERRASPSRASPPRNRGRRRRGRPRPRRSCPSNGEAPRQSQRSSGAMKPPVFYRFRSWNRPPGWYPFGSSFESSPGSQEITRCRTG